MDPWPNVQGLQRSSEWDDSGRNVVIDDIVAMVASTVSTASVVARSLEELSHHVGIEVCMIQQMAFVMEIICAQICN